MGSTESSTLLLGAETTSAAKDSGEWYRGVVDATGKKAFARWHRGDSERGLLRHAAEDDKRRRQGEGGKGWSRTDTTAVSTNAGTI